MENYDNLMQSWLLEALTIQEPEADKKVLKRIAAFTTVFYDRDVMRSAEMAQNYCSNHQGDNL